MNKTYKLDAIDRAAKKRPPGYTAAVLAAAKSRTETHVTLDARDAKRITDQYGGGIAVTRKPTDAEKATGGCSGCVEGKSSSSRVGPDAAWIAAVEQGKKDATDV